MAPSTSAPRKRAPSSKPKAPKAPKAPKPPKAEEEKPKRQRRLTEKAAAAAKPDPKPRARRTVPASESLSPLPEGEGTPPPGVAPPPPARDERAPSVPPVALRPEEELVEQADGTARVAIRAAPRALLPVGEFAPGEVIMSEPPLFVAPAAGPSSRALAALGAEHLASLLSSRAFTAPTAIAGVFAANSVDVGEGYAALGVGAYAEHSCAPNAGFSYCAECGDIQDEITASRWGTGTLARRAVERRGVIARARGEGCACAACAHESRVSDFRRELVREALVTRPVLELAAGGARALEGLRSALDAAEEEGLAEAVPLLLGGVFAIHAAWRNAADAAAAAGRAAAALRRVRGPDGVPPTHEYEVWARDPTAWEHYGAALEAWQRSPQGLRVAEYKGCLALLGPALDSACSATLARAPPQAPGTGPAAAALQPPEQLHVTLVTAAERKAASIPASAGVPVSVSVSHVYVLSPPQSRRRGAVRFLTVLWAQGDAWRRAHGLGCKEYHVTLSAEDDHTVPKGVGALAAADSAALLEQLSALGEVALDHAALACEGPFIAERMVADYPDSYRGYARLADSTPDPKAAALAYARAAALNPALLPRAAAQIEKLRDEVSYGAVLTAAERAALPPGIAAHLLHPWPGELDAALAHVLWRHGTASRERQISASYELPRFFSWLYPGRVAGMSTPRNAADVDALAAMGFTHVLSLTEETPLPEAWFRFVLEHVFVPVPNYHAPTLAEMDAVWGMVAEGGAWLVHCGGGVGRAGTVLACLVAMLGTGDEEGEVGVVATPRLDAGTAIALLRRARPRSLETEQQERFVAAWVSHRWKVAHASAAPLPEPVTLLSVEGDARAPIPAIFLIGRPGSGKSWLASALAKRRGSKKTVVVSQDESGSRAFSETQLSRAASLPPDTLLILDRCNPSRADRKLWLGLLAGRPCAAVYFDYPAALCRQRLDARLDHPTLRAGRGGNALAQMDREMQPPTLEEGWAAILTVSSLPAARQAVRHITPDPPLLKFPRTPHLLNLGASTADDVVLADFDELTGALVVEEKIDGANMGLSLDFDGAIRAQNRSHWVSSADHAQFKPLDPWVAAHGPALRRILGADAQFPERFILYGEWVVARHSIHYTALPGAFLAFDLYDRVEARFLSRRALARVLAGSGIPQVPLIAEASRLTREDVLHMVQGASAFTEGRREGVYVRTEDDERRYTVGRGKVVRGDFIAGNEHWARGPLVLNRFARD
ncbi:hypothetical protein Q8F55_000733 [Vanrija albida]|uniref:Tyrosine specific protein phosphatases domain-containing protein n=1 Tax=Vanrija albida TaxID=181172 RepID=A0ABR3QE43_9TREE